MRGHSLMYAILDEVGMLPFGRLAEDRLARFYRPGDRVRTRWPSWGEERVPKGSTGTVVWHDDNPRLLGVAFDHDPEGDGTGSWAMMYCQVEHVSLFKRARVQLAEHAPTDWQARSAEQLKRAAEALRAHGWSSWKRHEQATRMLPLCPAPNAQPGPGGGRVPMCLQPLPCARHKVTDPSLATLLYGSVLYQVTF